MDQSNQIEVYCDSANTTNKIVTIYGTKITVESLKRNVARLTNQIWKLIPMRENNEDWQKQINNVKLELIGLNAIFNFDSNYGAIKLDDYLNKQWDIIDQYIK